METPAQGFGFVAGFADKKKLVPETPATATLALTSVVSIIAWLQSNLLFTQTLQGTGRCSEREEQKLPEESESHQ